MLYIFGNVIKSFHKFYKHICCKKVVEKLIEVQIIDTFLIFHPPPKSRIILNEQISSIITNKFYANLSQINGSVTMIDY